MAASGLESVKDLDRSHIYRRISMNKVMTYEQIYPYPVQGSLLSS